MSQEWYEACAKRTGGYLQQWDSHIEGADGETAFTAWLRETIPTHPRVLDMGCGDGIYTLHMAMLAEHITGVDYGPSEVTARLTDSGFRILRNEEFRAKEILPTLTDLALFLSRVPGNPDYTAPEHRDELEALAAGGRTSDGWPIDRWWFLWVGTPA